MNDNCKYMRTKYNWTPNDYEIIFDYNKIPSNINFKDSADLIKHLNNRNALTKVLHLMMDTRNEEINDELMLYTELSFTNSNNETLEAIFK